eukprot:6170565-Prorocentrum_lima.AAC.1
MLHVGVEKLLGFCADLRCTPQSQGRRIERANAPAWSDPPWGRATCASSPLPRARSAREIPAAP